MPYTNVLTRSSKRVGWPGARTVAIALVAIAFPSHRLPAQSPAPIIDTIVIVTRNVFESPGTPAPRDSSASGPAVETVPGLRFLTRVANAVHVRTHASVIRRTLLLDQGARYDSARVLESERALRSLNVFREVAIDTTRIGNKLALRVVTADGWSTKPQLNYSSAGGDATWQGGIEEENFLGTATSLTALYTSTPDRNLGSFLYQNPHLFGRRPRLLGLYQTLSDGRRGAWGLSLPFYETAAPWALGTGGEVATQRVLQFRDDRELDAQGRFVDSLPTSPVFLERHALRFSLGGGHALSATTHGYTRVWMSGTWRREDFVAESATVIPRSTFVTVGAGIEIAHAHFAVMERFNTYGRREDVNLSNSLRAGLWAAPRAWGYPAGGAGVGAEASGQLSAAWPGGFAVLRGLANGVYNGTAFDSARAHASVTIASQNFVLQTLLVHFEGGVLRHPKPGAEFDTWIDQTGPRLFGVHAFTGTRSVWLAVEDRFVITDEFFGLVGVGLAPFFDWGGAWFDDEPVRTGSDIGIALRLGPTRAVRGDVQEFAVGWRFGPLPPGAGRLALAIRRGFAF